MDEKEAKHFYNSKAWKMKRLEILKRDHFECQDCIERVRSGKELKGYEKKIHKAVEVHHKIELREKPELGLDEDNLISLCTNCHNLRHGREPHHFNEPKERLTEEQW